MPAQSPSFHGIRLVTGIGTALLLLHLLIGDRWAPLAPLYYLSPFPLIGLLFLPGLFRQFHRRRWPRAGLFLFLCLAPACWQYRALLLPHPPVAPAASAQSLRVLFWTPDHYAYTSLPEAFAWMASLDADVIALVEGNVDFGRQKTLAKTHFPHQSMQLLDHGMLLIHSGEFLHRAFHFVDKQRGALQLCRLRIRGHELHIALYDQNSNPLYSRAPSLRQLHQRLPAPEVPVLLLGDFNLPHNAPSLAPLRRSLAPVFPHVNEGLPYTWPDSLPFLAIDQVWFSPHFQPLDVAVLPTSMARHRPILMNFTIESQPAQ